MCECVGVKENNYLEVLKPGRETYLENTHFFQSKHHPSSSSLQIIPEHAQGDAEILQTLGLKSDRTRNHRGSTEQYNTKIKNSHLLCVSH